ncbi:uncharacterized protein LOC131948811 [Physella acuta]|uniref:uncharacterized protein LOC131948811 n=1 Tax=Physella acuta TaxID=109671 RepID=UPI0027DD704A|nr:uncharacterized protein LOC131948811 [Physella acuta]
MFSPIQKQAVAFYLKSLENQRVVLAPALDSIMNAIEECKSSLTFESGNKKSFVELVQLLEETNSQNVDRFSTILKENGFSETTLIQNTANCFSTSQDNSSPDQLQSVDLFNKTGLEFQQKLDAASDLIERNHRVIQENIHALNDRLQNIETKQLSDKKKSKQYRRLVVETERNLKTLTDKIDEQNGLTKQITEQIKDMRSCVNKARDSANDNKKKIDILENKVNSVIIKSNNFEVSNEQLSEKQIQLGLHVETIDQKHTNVDLKCGTMCQMLAKRFKSLEYVNDVLSKLSLSKGETFLQINERLHELERSYGITRVGFSAMIWSGLKVRTGDVISDFSDVYFNHGGHFDPTSGEFTVPSDGIYCISLSVYKQVVGDVKIELVLVANVDDEEHEETDITIIFDVDTSSGRNYYISYDVLETGNILFLKVTAADEDFEFGKYSVITCYKI